MPHLILLICVVYLSSAFFTAYFYFRFTFIKVLWFMFQIADKLWLWMCISAFKCFVMTGVFKHLWVGTEMA